MLHEKHTTVITLHHMQVRAAKGWDAQQYLRFICFGQELDADDSVSEACGVVHCVASSTPPSRYISHKHSPSRKDAEQQPMHTVDWVSEVIALVVQPSPSLLYWC
jgi:hypothetical protein